MEDDKELTQTAAWRAFSEAFNSAMEEEKSISETFWKSLSSEEQLWVFCAITRRMSDAYLGENGGCSYRRFLYDVMDWGPEAYASAQCSGFLDIHNSIFSTDDLVNAVVNTNQQLGIETDRDAVEKIIIERRFY